MMYDYDGLVTVPFSPLFIIHTITALANIIHAYGRLLFYPGHGPMELLTKTCQHQLHTFTGQGLAMTICGMSNIRYHPGDAFLKAVDQAVIPVATTLDNQALANLWWGFANLGHVPTPEFWKG